MNTPAQSVTPPRKYTIDSSWKKIGILGSKVHTPPYIPRGQLTESSNEKPYQRPRFNSEFFRAKTVGAGAFSLDRKAVVRMRTNCDPSKHLQPSEELRAKAASEARGASCERSERSELRAKRAEPTGRVPPRAGDELKSNSEHSHEATSVQ